MGNDPDMTRKIAGPRQPGLFADFPVRDIPLNRLDVSYRQWIQARPDVLKTAHDIVAATWRIGSDRLADELRLRGMGLKADHAAYLIRHLAEEFPALRPRMIMRDVPGE